MARLEPEEIAFNKRINAVFLSKELSFEEAVREYRRIEEESVERDDEYKAMETRRRITEWIFHHAFYTEQPHEVCQEIWEELVQRGFSDHEQKRVFTGIYARFCQLNERFDAGIALLDPLIAEIHQALEGTTLTYKERYWYGRDLTTLCNIRDELRAGIRD